MPDPSQIIRYEIVPVAEGYLLSDSRRSPRSYLTVGAAVEAAKAQAGAPIAQVEVYLWQDGVERCVFSSRT